LIDDGFRQAMLRQARIAGSAPTTGITAEKGHRMT